MYGLHKKQETLIFMDFLGGVVVFSYECLGDVMWRRGYVIYLEDQVQLGISSSSLICS